jgi:hypothetical protein
MAMNAAENASPRRTPSGNHATRENSGAPWERGGFFHSRTFMTDNPTKREKRR